MGKITKDVFDESTASIATKAPLEQIDAQIGALSEAVDTNPGSSELKTVFETTKTREKQLGKAIVKNTKEVSEENEPLVAQMASVPPDKTFDTWVTTTGEEDVKR